jgi:hypothetical protein
MRKSDNPRQTFTRRVHQDQGNPATISELKYAPPSRWHWVPVEKLRYLTATALTQEQDPFFRYLKRGMSDFQRFYELHQPHDQFERIFLDSSIVGDFDNMGNPGTRHPWRENVPIPKDAVLLFFWGG